MLLTDLKCYNPKIFHGCIVPCGRCYACKLKRSNDWSIRLHEEYRNNNGKALFVTLTYDESLVPMSPDGVNVLCKNDVQLFHKRLRHCVERLNYFVVGEYGPTTLRPHYHGVYFGLDMSSYDDILRSWRKGYITASLVTDGRISYVAKYSLIPAKLPEYLLKKEYKPFMVCSKGLGISFLQNPQTIKSYNQDDRQYYNDNGYKKSLPRYYREKLFPLEKRVNFASEYYQQSREKLEELYELQKNSPEEFERKLKLKKDWVHAHSYDVENRLLKKPKI